MATEIKLTVNDKEYTIKQDNFSFTMFTANGKGTVSHLGKYPTKIGQALEIILDDSMVDRESKEAITLLDYIERYEAARDSIINTGLLVPIEKKSVERKKEPAPKKEYQHEAKPPVNPFDLL